MLGTQLAQREYLQRCARELDNVDIEALERMSDAIFKAYEQGRFVFICGNGGSGSNASHFCEDLGKTIEFSTYPRIFIS